MFPACFKHTSTHTETKLWSRTKYALENNSPGTRGRGDEEEDGKEACTLAACARSPIDVKTPIFSIIFA